MFNFLVYTAQLYTATTAGCLQHDFSLHTGRLQVTSKGTSPATTPRCLCWDNVALSYQLCSLAGPVHFSWSGHLLVGVLCIPNQKYCTPAISYTEDLSYCQRRAVLELSQTSFTKNHDTAIKHEIPVLFLYRDVTEFCSLTVGKPNLSLAHCALWSVGPILHGLPVIISLK